MQAEDQKDQRLNVRLSSAALTQIREAASVSQQDVTSFLLGAGLDRARAILAERLILQMSPSDVAALEAGLDREPEMIRALRGLLDRIER